MFLDTSPKPGPLTPALVAQDGPLVGRRFPIVAEAVIGRVDADIVLRHPLVSRRHALIRPVEDGLEVEDLGSVNSTYVNGNPIEGSFRLSDRDVLEIGGMRLFADIPEPGHPEKTAPAVVTGALLIVRDGALEGQRCPVAGEILIGRGQGDLQFDDVRISRRHAAVRLVPGGVELEDLGSTNGTRVNGTEIKGAQRLKDGDVITVGRTSLDVHLSLTEANVQATLMAPPASA